MGKELTNSQIAAWYHRLEVGRWMPAEALFEPVEERPKLPPGWLYCAGCGERFRPGPRQRSEKCEGCRLAGLKQRTEG